MGNKGSSKKISPYVILGLGVMASSTAAIFIRFAEQSSSSLTIAAFRLMFAVILLTPITLVRNRDELLSIHRKQILLMFLSGTLLALHFATWISSLQFTSVASSVVLVTTTPLWVALFSPMFLNERITRVIIIGLLIALLGGVIVGMSDSCTWVNGTLNCPPIGALFAKTEMWGNILAISGALLAAGYLIVGRLVRAVVPLGAYIYVVYGIAAGVLLFIALVTHQKMIGLPWIDYLWFFALAAIPQLLGHTSFNWSLKYLPAAYVSIALLGEPIGSTILAYVILKEAPTLLKIGGAALILSGILVSSINKNDIKK